MQSLNLINGTLSNAALGSAAAPISGSNLNFIGGPNYLWKPTQLDTWSFTFERQIIPRGVLSLAYVGSAAHDLNGGFDYNFPNAVSGPSVITRRVCSRASPYRQAASNSILA